MVEVRGARSFSCYESELDIGYVRVYVCISGNVPVGFFLILTNAVTFGWLVRSAGGTPAYFRMGLEHSPDNSPDRSKVLLVSTCTKEMYSTVVTSKQ